MCLVQFVDVLGVTVVITALPRMLADLHASSAATSLVVTGYAMFFGGLLVLGARVGDRYGQRRTLLWGIVGFAAASLLASASWSVYVLVLARCLQGATAAFSVPAALSLISLVAEDETSRRRGLALWSACGAAAGASGFVLGGLATEFGSWRLIFWVNVALAAGLATAIHRTVPPTRIEGIARLDVTGAVLLTAAVMAVVVGATLLQSAGTRALALGVVLVGAAVVPLLVVVERRAPEPLLPGAALRHPGLRTGSLNAWLNTATTSSAMTLATIHLQEASGLGPSSAGLLLLPFSLAVVVGAWLAPRALSRWSLRRVGALGLALVAAGDLALFAVNGAVLPVPFCVALAGFGIGLSSVASTTLGTDVPPDLQGVASGILNTAAQLGTALGVAAILLIASLAGGFGGPSAGARAGWLAAGVLALFGAALVGRSQQ